VSFGGFNNTLEINACVTRAIPASLWHELILCVVDTCDLWLLVVRIVILQICLWHVSPGELFDFGVLCRLIFSATMFAASFSILPLPLPLFGSWSHDIFFVTGSLSCVLLVNFPFCQWRYFLFAHIGYLSFFLWSCTCEVRSHLCWYLVCAQFHGSLSHEFVFDVDLAICLVWYVVLPYLMNSVSPAVSSPFLFPLLILHAVFV
jgi:hypothetical protein